MIGLTGNGLSTELTGGKLSWNLGTTASAMTTLGSASTVEDTIGTVDLLDAILQLVTRVPILLEQRPHRINNKQESVDTVVNIHEIRLRWTASPRRLRGKLCRLCPMLTQHVPGEES